jgi:hypothetical protein
MTIKKKHKLMIMMMTRQSNTASYIHIQHKKKSWYFVYSSVCLHTRFYLKGFLLLLLEWREKEKNDLPPLPARRSMITLDWLSSAFRRILRRSFSRAISLSPLLRTLIVLHRWIIYTLTIIWQWLCAWPQCEREHIYIYTSWKTRSKGEST